MAKFIPGEKEYWNCTIGPTTRDKLPDGSDLPMRQAVEDAFRNIVGEYSAHCWSGWGLSDYVREAKEFASFHPEEVHALMQARRDRDV